MDTMLQQNCHTAPADTAYRHTAPADTAYRHTAPASKATRRLSRTGASRTILFAALLVLLLTALTACGGGQPKEITRSFGPVTVTIAGGEAEVSYEALEGAYPIIANGKVKDVAIGVVPYAEYTNVVLLLEDGTIEWAWINPDELRYLELVYTLGTLPWITDIAEVTYEESGGQPDLMTFYAVDKDGLTYNLEWPFGLLRATDVIWSYIWVPEHDDYEHIFSSAMSFRPDGTTEMTTGWGDPNGTWETLSGTYRVFFDEEASEGYQPGTLLFDLTSEEDGRSVSGKYFINATFGDTMFLTRLEGDALFELEGLPVTYYEYCGVGGDYDLPLPDVVEMTDEELVDYMLLSVPGLQRLVDDEGMELRVTGQVTELYDEEWRDVELGHKQDGKFNIRRQYTVSPSGLVYLYDPEGDAYLTVN